MEDGKQHPQQFQLDYIKAVVTNALADKTEKKTSETPWWIKVFGGTFLVMASTIVLGAFQNLYSKIYDLENITRTLSEKCVKQDDLSVRMQAQWNAIKELQAGVAKFSTMEEKLKMIEANQTRIDKDIRNVISDNAKIRERLATIDKKVIEEDKK